MRHRSPNLSHSEGLGSAVAAFGSRFAERQRSTPATMVAAVAFLIGLAGANSFGAAADGEAGLTNLAPLELKLPPPLMGNWILDDPPDPHFEPRGSGPRVPLLAPFGVTNLAFQKGVTSSDELISRATLRRITDGQKETSPENVVSLASKQQWVQVDLGSPSGIYAVVIWHDQRDHRIFRCVAVQTADDAEFTRNVQTLFNNDYANELRLGVGTDKLYRESHEGRLIDAKGVKARYLRCYSKGSNLDPFNAYTEIEVWGLPAK